MSKSNKNKTEQQNNPATNASWGGRFNEPVDDFVARFTASVDFDQRLAQQDIQGSVAHAKMLAKASILSKDELNQIIQGLSEIGEEINSGQFAWSQTLEDVHMNIEAALTERIGIVGKKLHTGRSRNDQVATDIRLWLRDQIDTIKPQISQLQLNIIAWPKKKPRP